MGHFWTIIGGELDHPSGPHFTRVTASLTRSNFQVQTSSNRPQSAYNSILRKSPGFSESGCLLSPAPVDTARSDTLKEAFIVISLVGSMHGSPEDFDRIQHPERG